GDLNVADLPEAWDEKMTSSLGLRTIDNPKDGPMQDVHWPAGAFGYFPSYTLGAMIAAQQWQAITANKANSQAEISHGNFQPVNEWRAEHIWSQGSRYPTPELLRRATGKPLDPKVFIAHLKQRYL